MKLRNVDGNFEQSSRVKVKIKAPMNCIFLDKLRKQPFPNLKAIQFTDLSFRTAFKGRLRER